MSDDEQRPPFKLTKDLLTCRVRGRPGRFYILKICPQKARVLPTDQPNCRGFLVNKTDLRDIRSELTSGPSLFPDEPDPEPDQPEPPEEEIEQEDTSQLPFPYGLADLDDFIISEKGPPLLVKCYVRDCEEILQPPSRGFRGELCKKHKIFCHLSGSNVTYTYRDPRRNLIVSPELFMKKVRRNPHKLESHRFTFCNSEDAVSWNILRSFQETKVLRLLAQWITGQEISEEPLLYLWGLSSSDNRFEPWPLLTEARKRFEIAKLPIARPLSEPDGALVIPRRFLIIIECKVLAPNPVVYRDQPRKSSQSLTFEELIALYQDGSLQILDFDKIRSAECTWPQLHRYLVLAEYMAQLDGPNTKAYLTNLVRAGQEHESASGFRQFLRPEFADRFVRMNWESVYALSGLHWPKLSRLREYMLTKAVGVSGGFAPAFQLDAW